MARGRLKITGPHRTSGEVRIITGCHTSAGLSSDHGKGIYWRAVDSEGTIWAYARSFTKEKLNLLDRRCLLAKARRRLKRWEGELDAKYQWTIGY